MRHAPQAPAAAMPATAAPTVIHRVRPARQERRRHRDVHRGDERRQAVDAGHARHLRDRQHLHLAVAERHPRKAAEERAAHELGGRPGRRDQRQRPVAERGQARRGRGRGCRGIQRQVAGQEQHRERRHRQRQAAELRQHPAGPIQRAGEVDEAGPPPQQEGAPDRRSASGGPAGRAHARPGSAAPAPPTRTPGGRTWES